MAYTRPSSSSTALPEPFRHENLDLESGHILQKIEDLKNTVATLEDERRQLWSIFESLTPRSIPYASLPTLKERVSAAKETLLSYVMFPNLAVWAQQETAFDHIIAAQKRATDLEEKLTKIALLAAKATSATRHTIKNIPTIGSSPCPVSQISLEYEDKAIQSGVEATIDHTRVNQRHGTRTDLEEKVGTLTVLALLLLGHAELFLYALFSSLRILHFWLKERLSRLVVRLLAHQHVTLR
ncbi:hypothetical protein DL96DRAFT_1702976 [Flagelloscypha sp. PMI_526]|nr:hypothetical protein DL96DRAFT_1702976 [Flagelloscypha sp. PMI_526]